MVVEGTSSAGGRWINSEYDTPDPDVLNLTTETSNVSQKDTVGI